LNKYEITLVFYQFKNFDHTYGSGNHPTKTYSFEDKNEFFNKIEQLKKDDYKFIKDQAQ